MFKNQKFVRLEGAYPSRYVIPKKKKMNKEEREREKLKVVIGI